MFVLISDFDSIVFSDTGWKRKGRRMAMELATSSSTQNPVLPFLNSSSFLIQNTISDKDDSEGSWLGENDVYAMLAAFSVCCGVW